MTEKRTTYYRVVCANGTADTHLGVTDLFQVRNNARNLDRHGCPNCDGPHRIQGVGGQMTDKKYPLDGIPHGTRIRVTYEGVVSRSPMWQWVFDDDATRRYIGPNDTVEVIALPDPEWWPPQYGDIVLEGNNPWQRLADGKWFGLGFSDIHKDEDFRDAPLIARDGKPYPPREEK